MFKFNFVVNEADSGECQIDFKNDLKSTVEEDGFSGVNNHPKESREIFPNAEIVENLDVYSLNSTELPVGDEMSLIYIVPKFLFDFSNSEAKIDMDLCRAEANHSDLIPGVYEGGAKLWECTIDLLNFLHSNCNADDWKNKSVLDLGCGAGLLGIYAAIQYNSKVVFQDYNTEVLEKITIPNVLLNVMANGITKSDGLEQVQENYKFYSGDWSGFKELSHDKFDLILSSETIYNPENQSKLLDTLCSSLNANGRAYIAAKTYYFGVGGGLRQFEELIKKKGNLQSRVVWTSEIGVGREILELTINKTNA